MQFTASPVPVSGIWYRHVRAGAGAQGRWQHAETVGAIYLADSPDTVRAEFYRALAEKQLAPMAAMPRDLWRYRARLEAVADLSDPDLWDELGLAAPIPDRHQCPAFQALGERLAGEGIQGVLYPLGRASLRALSVRV